MTIQELGSLGELIAAIATVATLIYLALQIRANTSALRVDARRAEWGATGDFSNPIINNPDVARIFNAGLADPAALSPEEATRFTFLMGRIFASESMFFEEVGSGFATKEALVRRKVTLSRFLLTPGGRWFWERFASDFPPEFRSYVSDQVLGTRGSDA